MAATADSAAGSGWAKAGAAMREETKQPNEGGKSSVHGPSPLWMQKRVACEKCAARPQDSLARFGVREFIRFLCRGAAFHDAHAGLPKQPGKRNSRTQIESGNKFPHSKGAQSHHQRSAACGLAALLGRFS